LQKKGRIGVLNRLLENWLDSASEKTYQPVLCQILSAKKHTVLHTTRHSAIEFGKDIITTDPEGVPCGFQLKGNPGSRLTLQQFRDIQGQLVQLVTQPIEIPGQRIKAHNTYLVTNGQIEEEVYVALNQLNRGFEAQNTIGRPIQVISRGQLLQWAQELGSDLWPFELHNIGPLFHLLSINGREIYPINLLHNLLTPMLFLTNNHKQPGANILNRMIYSAAILTAVSLNQFALEKNHYAIISAWVLYSAYVIGACDRFNYSFRNNAKKAIDITVMSIFITLSNLCEEIRNRDEMIEGMAFVDNFVLKWRFTLVVGLMALYFIWCENEEWPKEEQREFLLKFLPKEFKDLLLWGEGVIPQLLILIWYLRANDATIRPDHLLANLLWNVVSMNTLNKLQPLASPYYCYDDILEYNLRGFLGLKEDPFKGESFKNSSFFAEGLLHLLVRTNLKQTCKNIWPNYSKLFLKQFVPSKRWKYCLIKDDEGEEISIQPPLTKEWGDLIEEARNISCPEIPENMAKNKFLLMLFIIIFPYRALPSAIRYLGGAFNDCWYIAPPKL
jgi:hypothetical protein